MSTPKLWRSWQAAQGALRRDNSLRVLLGLLVAAAVAILIWTMIDDGMLLAGIAFVVVFWMFYLWNILSSHLPPAGSPIISALNAVQGSTAKKDEVAPKQSGPKPGGQEAAIQSPKKRP
jgi:hypothetical protein